MRTSFLTVLFHFQRQVFLTSVVIVCVIVRIWKLLPITISNTAERISTIPTASLNVNNSPKTSTPMATLMCQRQNLLNIELGFLS